MKTLATLAALALLTALAACGGGDVADDELIGPPTPRSVCEANPKACV